MTRQTPRKPRLSVLLPVSDYRLSAASYRITDTGQSAAVTLRAADDPRIEGCFPIAKPRTVYIRPADTPEAHLVNRAMHGARAWLQQIEDDLWHARLVVVCRPLRAKCKPMLQAIGKTARNQFGATYWRTRGGRDLLTRELRMMGVEVPPHGPVNHFMALAGSPA